MTALEKMAEDLLVMAERFPLFDAQEIENFDDSSIKLLLDKAGSGKIKKGEIVVTKDISPNLLALLKLADMMYCVAGLLEQNEPRTLRIGGYATTYKDIFWQLVKEEMGLYDELPKYSGIGMRHDDNGKRVVVFMPEKKGPQLPDFLKGLGGPFFNPEE